MSIESNFLGAVGATAGFVSSAYNTSKIAQDGNWHNVILVGHDAVEDLYIDGIFQGTINFQSQLDIFAIGNTALTGVDRFADNLDEFYLYNRVLSDIEIQALYNEGRGLAGNPSFTTTTTTTTSTTTTTTTIIQVFPANIGVRLFS